MKLIIPTHIDIPRKRSKPKRIYFSFNVVKTLHYQVYNDVKHRVGDLIRDQLAKESGAEWVALKPPVQVICTMYNNGERSQDLDNAFPVVKFSLDALVNLGYLPDDSVKFVKQVSYVYGGKDKMDPRYEVTVLPLHPLPDSPEGH